jgi:hypothetical protein
MRLVTTFLAIFLSLAGPAVHAAELLMFEEKWCTWCERWNVEVGDVYDKTEEGRRAPLRRIDMHGDFPKDIQLASRPQFTPTFVLVADGREVGRIEGYPGEDFFWGLLNRLLAKLPPPAAGRSGAAGAGET